MSIDFSRLTSRSAADEVLDPSRIFAALPARTHPYLRDVQGQVLERWLDRRDQHDVVIKMNTGAGKTVVGLLLLKSCLNERKGPAVYLAADNYLVDQVVAEANQLGIEVTLEPDSARFASGQAILVTNVWRLFNGRSVFGVGTRGVRIGIGSLLVDDAHACVAIAEDQFSVRLPQFHEGWGKLVRLFRYDLQAQARSEALAIEDGDPRAILELPYWAWQDKQAQATAILHSYRGEDEFGFHWPLISDSLPSCRVAVGGGELQIMPPCLPIEAVPSFVRAGRRIFMTATLPDDGILVESFGADPAQVRSPVTPHSADDLGDRMILVPQETHPQASDSDLRAFVAAFAKDVNVVVIVPSGRRAEAWKEHAHLILSKDNLYEGVARLRAGHVGLAVLVNRYDGVDLPGDACRVLVIDGVPEAQSPMERIQASALAGSTAMTQRQVQRIEQGMGRGIRSNDDYCVVLLLGASLVRYLQAPGAEARLSPGTLAQIRLSRQLSGQLQGLPLPDLQQVIRQCLARDPGWVTASRNAVVGVTYPAEGTVGDVSVARRHAFDASRLGRHLDAARELRELVRSVDDPLYRGWLKQEAGSYLNQADRVAAQQLQMSAVEDNPSLLKPLVGVAYARLSAPHLGQARACVTFLHATYGESANAMLLGFESLLAALCFRPDDSDAFEAAMRDLGLHIGLGAQRPEHDTGSGPDVLWSTGDLRYVIIECKSEAEGDIPKKDAAQLGSSMDWFFEHYDQSCRATPTIVHPTGRFRREVVPPREGTRVIDEDRLGRLNEAVRGFATAVSASGGYRDVQVVTERLRAYQLNGDALLQNFTLVARSGS